MVGWTLRRCCIRRWMSGRRTTAITPGRRFSTLTKINDQECEGAEPGMDVSAAEERRCSGRTPGGHSAGGERDDVYHVHRIKCGPWTPAPGASCGLYAGPPKVAFTWATGGLRISGNSLYFETPDCNLVSLNLADGTKLLESADLRSGSDVLRLNGAGGDQKSRHYRG